MKTKAILFFSWLMIALTGCSANHHSIYRHHQIEDGPSITMVDAKQRAILAAKPKLLPNEQNKSIPIEDVTRFCAEPSPDVFAVIAQALSGGASFGRSGDPKTIQAALNAAFSSSEQGSTIPRTQTTNTLREVMYRTCERYLSGGISGVELSIQAVRDQRLIVSILAIEGLTGAVTARPVVIGSSASGSSGSSGADAAIRLDDQSKLVGKKTEVVAKKQAAFDELNGGTTKECDAIAKAVADKKEDGLSQALKDKKPKCEAASAELTAAKKEKTEAEAHYKALADVASTGGMPVTAGGALMTPMASGGLDTAQRSDISHVATAVKEIVAGTFSQDEYLFLCLKVLQSTGEKLGEVSQNCIEYIKSQVDLERVKNGQSIESINAARAKIEQHSNTLFDKFWALVSTTDQIDPAKLAVVQKDIKAKDWPTCFASAKTKAEYQKCFNSNGVVSDVKRDLSKGKSND